ncbi:type 1 glutamine amidotransferase domain-containing protein [Thiohalorhabdus methylotrophus]|uniref:Type 1 glutamine amidotransferase domain-containing protein n=1 Tax=Thiohalorhabdus methylotrophus TaxID=3242694 RepID=A0ABV4U0J6_9GAMM
MSEQPRILMVVTSHDRIDDNHTTGLWYEEFAAPYRIFREQGAEVVVASPKGGPAPIDPRSAPEDTSGDEAWPAIQATKALEEVSEAEYDAIFLPGGHGTMFDFPENALLVRVIERLNNANKVVSGVCHGPAALVHANRSDGHPIVEGHTLTAFTNGEEEAVQLKELMPFLLESRLREAGGQVVAADNWENHVEVDGNLITGQNPQSSRHTAQAVMDALAS